MENKPSFDGEDFYDNIKAKLNKQLENVKKIANEINQLRVDAAFLELDLLMLVNAPAWQNICELIGNTMYNDLPMNEDDQQPEMDKSNNK